MHKNSKSTVQIQTDEHLQNNISKRDRRVQLATYRRQDLGNGGNQEPNQTLVMRGSISADREHHGQREVLRAHLFLQEASHAKRAAFVEA